MINQWLIGSIIVLGITIRIVYILVHRHLDKKLAAENTNRITL
ncbi:hypothetical protein RCG17_09830 [Neobacillus sp. PS3-12]|nr:hypothetical protein [Neobacillus sp. PS3-12]WML54863.1 hypothetical protein RCG17_09830 [Neobacillus sp. PS3-12]